MRRFPRKKSHRKKPRRLPHRYLLKIQKLASRLVRAFEMMFCSIKAGSYVTSYDTRSFGPIERLNI